MCGILRLNLNFYKKNILLGKKDEIGSLKKIRFKIIRVENVIKNQVYI